MRSAMLAVFAIYCGVARGEPERESANVAIAASPLYVARYSPQRDDRMPQNADILSSGSKLRPKFLLA